MKIGGFKGILLVVVACFSLFLSLLLVNNSNAQVGGQATVISGKSTGYNFNLAGYPPLKWYTSAPPVMVAAKVGSGAVVATGIASTCRDNRWNNPDNPDPYLDVLFDKAFQWMKPGATKVLWYEGYGVYNTISNSPVQCANLRDALQAKGYTLTGDATTPITTSLLSSYDIVVIPQLELPTADAGTGGDPSLLPDAEVQAIVSFVNGGNGLLIMEQSDFAGHNFNKVQNKILKTLGAGFYFQDDQVQDDNNKWAGATYQPIANIDNTTAIGSAFESSTGTAEIGLYDVCSLRMEENYDISVMVSPTVNFAKAGETMTYTATITNIGLKPDNYTILVEDNLGWPLSLSENNVHLENGENADIYVNVTVPSDLAQKMVDWVTLNASGFLGEENENARFRAINTFPENQPEYPIARPDVPNFLGPAVPDLTVDLPAVPIITAIGSGYSNDLTPRAPWPLLYGQGEFPPVAAAAFAGNGRVAAIPNSILRDAYFERAELSNEKVLSKIARWMENWGDPEGDNFLYFVAGPGVYNVPSIVSKWLGLLGGLGFNVTTQVDGEITSTLLENVAILNIAELMRPLSANEIQAVANFVEGGGGLIIMCQADYGGYGLPDYPNAVLENLNCPIRFQDDEVYDDNSWVYDGPWFPQVYLLDPRQVDPNFDVWFPLYDFTVSMPIRAVSANDVRVLFPFTITNTGIMNSSYTLGVQETSSTLWGVNWWPTGVDVASGKNIDGYIAVTVPKIEVGNKRMDLVLTATDQNQTFLSDNISFAILGDNMVTIPSPKFENSQKVSVIQGGEGTIVDLGYSGAGVWTYVVQTTGGETRIVPEEELTYLGSHSPIYINGNGNFTVANGVNGGGSGTENDPYLIENWDISAGDSDGIRIINTTAHFTIRNCYVHDGLSGISFDNVINGRIDGTLISNTTHFNGICLYYSDNNTIQNCIIENNNDYGIWLQDNSDNNIIENCIVKNNYWGIKLELSSNNLLRSNALSNNSYNFIVMGYSISDYSHDIDNSNRINGKPLFYLKEREDLVIDGNIVNVGYLGLISCENIRVQNLHMSNNGEGILLVDTNRSTITNSLTETNLDGIWFNHSSNNTIVNCAVENNRYDGILLGYSSNFNIVTNCIVEDTRGNGIFLFTSNSNVIENSIVRRNYINNGNGFILGGSNNNTIQNCISEGNFTGIRLYYFSNNNYTYHNNFVNNDNQAYDDGSNSWDNGYPSGGNYWSDYAGVDNYCGENQDIPGGDGVGDTPYNIPGGSNHDLYPQMHLFTPLVITPGTISGKPFVDGAMINDNTPTLKLSITDATIGLENAPFDITDNSGYTVQLQEENGVTIATLFNATPPTETMPKTISFENTYPMALADGTYRLYVVAGDNLQMDNLIITFMIDTTSPDAPTLTATASQNPLAPDIKKTTTTSLGGIGEPGATIRIWIMPEPFTFETNVENVVVDSDGTWTGSITLVQGVTVRIRVSQVDIAGNESTKNQYGYLKVDASAPVVQIISPATGTKTADTEILVSGTVTKDAWESYTLDITLRVQNGVAYIIIPIANDGAFSVDVPLAEGLNTIMATATDAVGNHTSHIVTVERQVTPPVTPPKPGGTTPPLTPSLISPANGENLNDNTPTLDWSDVIDSSGVNYGLAIARDAGFASIVLQKAGLAASNYKLTSAEALAAGVYYWRVRAVDGAGNAGSWSDNWPFAISSPKLPLPPQQSVKIPLITPGAPANVDVRSTDVTTLGLSVLHTVENVEITIQELVDRPSELAVAAPGVIYCYLDITKVNIANNNISSVTITFRVEKVWITADLIDENTISLKRYNSENDEWGSLPTVKVGDDINYLYFSATSPGLSYFAVSGTVITTAPAAFAVSSLIISPSQISVGQKVSISLAVQNTGDLAGTCTITLKINNIIEDTENATLSGGATKIVTFTISENTTGIYNVDVNGQTGAFTVTKPQPAPTVLPLVFGFAGAVVAIGIAILLITRWR